jgi:hypothetical protein
MVIAASVKTSRTTVLALALLAHLQAVGAQFAVEVGAFQADGLGGGADVAAVLLELAL